MGGGPFLAGGEPGLADLWLAPAPAYFRMGPEGQAAMAARCGLTARLGRLEARPSFVRTVPRFG